MSPAAQGPINSPWSNRERATERSIGARDFPGDGFRADREKPVDTVQKYARRRLMRRLVRDGERTYHAYSADELIEIDSLAHHGRPGMPY